MGLGIGPIVVTTPLTGAPEPFSPALKPHRYDVMVWSYITFVGRFELGLVGAVAVSMGRRRWYGAAPTVWAASSSIRACSTSYSPERTRSRSPPARSASSRSDKASLSRAIGSP